MRKTIWFVFAMIFGASLLAPGEFLFQASIAQNCLPLSKRQKQLNQYKVEQLVARAGEAWEGGDAEHLTKSLLVAQEFAEENGELDLFFERVGYLTEAHYSHGGSSRGANEMLLQSAVLLHDQNEDSLANILFHNAVAYDLYQPEHGPVCLHLPYLSYTDCQRLGLPVEGNLLRLIEHNTRPIESVNVPAEFFRFACHFPNVQKLEIEDNLNGDQFSYLCRHMPEFKGLKLDVGKLTNKSLAALKSLKNLESLELTCEEREGSARNCIANIGLNEEGIRSIASLKCLRNLSLDVKIQHASSLESLASLPSLNEIFLLEPELNQVRDLTACPAIRRVVLEGETVDRASLLSLSKLENLESISLWRTLVTPADVKLLSDLPKLERFYVNDQTSDSSSWVAAIQALPHLTGERHSHHYGTQDITQFPKGLTELEVLSANAHQLQYCGRFNRLRGVSLKYDVSDNDLKYLSGISSIEGIKIQSEKATASFAPFGTGFENLKSLAIWTPIMSRTGMEAISKLRNLHTLCLRTRANPDLSYLTQLPDLSELDLRSTPIDDESQTHLLKMKGLKKLDLRGTNLSLDAIERLENGLPHCEVTPSPALWRATLPKRLQNRRKKPQVKSCILGPGCD